MLRLVDKHWGVGGLCKYFYRYFDHVRNASLITPLSKRYVIVQQPHIVYIIYIPEYLF